MRFLPFLRKASLGISVLPEAMVRGGSENAIRMNRTYEVRAVSRFRPFLYQIVAHNLSTIRLILIYNRYLGTQLFSSTKIIAIDLYPKGKMEATGISVSFVFNETNSIEYSINFV